MIFSFKYANPVTRIQKQRLSGPGHIWRRESCTPTPQTHAPRRRPLTLEIRDMQRQNAHMTISTPSLGWGPHTRCRLSPGSREVFCLRSQPSPRSQPPSPRLQVHLCSSSRNAHKVSRLDTRSPQCLFWQTHNVSTRLREATRVSKPRRDGERGKQPRADPGGGSLGPAEQL